MGEKYHIKLLLNCFLKPTFADYYIMEFRFNSDIMIFNDLKFHSHFQGKHGALRFRDHMTKRWLIKPQIINPKPLDSYGLPSLLTFLNFDSETW